MLAYMRGTLTEIQEDAVILENQGIGYRIFMPALDMQALPDPGNPVRIYLHMQVREDGISLYGFCAEQTRELFRLLIGISGVGPKAGISLLSALSAEEIQLAVLSGDAKALRQANGIGTKGAQRIIMELRDKIELESMLEPHSDTDARPDDKDVIAEVSMALVSLGYSQTEAMQAIRRTTEAQQTSTETLLKAALKHLI